ncbi:hypothetical protein FRB99_004969 [Tulasnella sp. 403]|nr:hypothetical protein FRB99_004969 [Tulasnella sp. 403]
MKEKDGLYILLASSIIYFVGTIAIGIVIWHRHRHSLYQPAAHDSEKQLATPACGELSPTPSITAPPPSPTSIQSPASSSDDLRRTSVALENSILDATDHHVDTTPPSTASPTRKPSPMPSINTASLPIIRISPASPLNSVAPTTLEVVGGVVLDYPPDLSGFDGYRYRPISETVEVFIRFPWDEFALHLRINWNGATVDDVLTACQVFFGCNRTLTLFTTPIINPYTAVFMDAQLRVWLLCAAEIPRLEFWALPDGYYPGMSRPTWMDTGTTSTDDAPIFTEDEIARLAEGLPGLTPTDTWVVYPDQAAHTVPPVFSDERTRNELMAKYIRLGKENLEKCLGFRNQKGELVEPYDVAVLEQVMQHKLRP